MPPPKITYDPDQDPPSSKVKEGDIEDDLVRKLTNLKYTYRPDIRDRAALEANFRSKFQQLNAVTLSDSEFARLVDQITTADVYKSAEILRTRNSFERDDGTPLNFTLVNIRDWCKNDFEVGNQLRINTQNSHQRYDVILLINGNPCVQIELKTLDISPRRAMQQIVEYKADPGNGYTKSPLRDYPYGIVKQSKLDEDVAVSPLYGVFSPRNKHISALVEAYFDSPYRSKRFIGPLAQKGAKNTINITNQGFLSGKLPVPLSEAEQQEIADCVSALDALITAQTEQVAALKEHKKGLMQKLFPNPELCKG